MKKLIKLVLLINLMVCTNNVKAQNATIKRDTIELDFSDPKSKLPDTSQMTHNKKYVIKLINVNLNLFKVDGTVSQQDYNTDMPEIFKGIGAKLPGYLSIALPDVPDTGMQRKLAMKQNDEETKKEEIERHLKTIANSLLQIKKTVKLNNDLKNLYNSCDLKFTEIVSAKQDTINRYLGTSLTDEKQIVHKLRQVLSSTIENSVSAKNKIDIVLPLYLADIERLLEPLREYIKQMEDKAAQNIKLTDKEKLIVTNNKKEIKATEAIKDKIVEQVTEAKTFVEELKKFDDENKIEELVINYKMLNESNFTYYSEPIKVKNDEVKIELKITSDKLLPCNIPTKKTYSNTYNTKGGVKVDFSSGVFVNGGNDDFLGRELQYKKIDDTTVQIQAKDGGKRLLISVGGLMHIYWRSGNKVNYAISPGLSTTTALDGINFHLGASAIFGGENRLVLSAGLVLREAKILDRNFNYNTNYAKSDMPETVPTIKVFPKAGWFFGVTYNWSKLKSK